MNLVEGAQDIVESHEKPRLGGLECIPEALDGKENNTVRHDVEKGDVIWSLAIKDMNSSFDDHSWWRHRGGAPSLFRLVIHSRKYRKVQFPIEIKNDSTAGIRRVVQSTSGSHKGSWSSL